MAITVYCEQCQQTYKVKDDLAGKRGKCKNGHPLVIPMSSDTADTPATKAPIPSPAKNKSAKATAKQKKCPSCKSALANDAVLCVDCGFDLRTGRKVGATPASRTNSLVFLLVGNGVAAVFFVFASSAALYFLWPSSKEASPHAQKDGPPKPPTPNEKSNPLPGEIGKPQQPIPEPTPKPKVSGDDKPKPDVNSKLTISDVKAITADGSVKITATCTWSGKPNPDGYKMGLYRFETPVSEVNGMKVKTPDVQQGAATFDAKHETASFEVTPETSLKSVAALVAKIHLRIGESNELTIDASSVTAGPSSGPPKAEDYPKDLIGVWLATTDDLAKQPDVQLRFEFQASGACILTVTQGKISNQTRGKWFFKENNLSMFMNGQKGKPVAVQWVNADEFTTKGADGATGAFRREGKGAAKIDPAPAGKDMHYTVKGDLVLIHNTPWGQQTFKMTFPPGSSGGTGTVYVGDKLEPRIRVVYDRKGVSAVTVDGKAIPRGK